jgi:hypothetical protein
MAIARSDRFFGAHPVVNPALWLKLKKIQIKSQKTGKSTQKWGNVRDYGVPDLFIVRIHCSRNVARRCSARDREAIVNRRQAGAGVHNFQSRELVREDTAT